MYTAVLPPARELNEIQRPSGDHAGPAVYPPSKCVNCMGFFPSAPETQISGLPERSDAKASRSPSGEILTVWSKRVEATTLIGFPDSGVPVRFVKSTRQISASMIP